MNILFQEFLASFVFLSIAYMVFMIVFGLKKKPLKTIIMIYIGVLCFQTLKITTEKNVTSILYETLGFTASTLIFIFITKRIFLTETKNKVTDKSQSK